MKNSETQRQYNVSEENNQLVIILNSEIRLPKDAPVRVTSAQLEELDYRKLYAAYSSKGEASSFGRNRICKAGTAGRNAFERERKHRICLRKVEAKKRTAAAMGKAG